MKILDLFEQIQTKVTDRKYSGSLKPRSKWDNHSNYGNFARVTGDKNDPHMVVKNDTKPKAPVQRPDKYYRYISALIENDLINTNPHFPRVYDIEKIADKHGVYIYKYRMEKLNHWNELEIDELAALADMVCVDPVPEEFFDEQRYDEQAAKWRISDFIQTAIMNKLIEQDTIKLDTLNDALDLINMIGDDIGSMANDAAGDNVMIRRTSKGSQIVITDPFYG